MKHMLEAGSSLKFTLMFFIWIFVAILQIRR